MSGVFSGLALDASGMDGEVESLVNMAVLRLKGQRVRVRAFFSTDVRTDAPRGGQRLVKSDSGRKIDCAIALVIAIGVMEIASEPPP